MASLPLGSFYECHVFGETSDRDGVTEFFRRYTGHSGEGDREAFEELNVTRIVTELRSRTMEEWDFVDILKWMQYRCNISDDEKKVLKMYSDELRTRGGQTSESFRKELEKLTNSHLFKAALQEYEDKRTQAKSSRIQVIQMEGGSQYLRTEVLGGKSFSLNDVRVIWKNVKQVRVQAGDAISLFESSLGLHRSGSNTIRGIQWRHRVTGVTTTLFTLNDMSSGASSGAFVDVSVVSDLSGKEQAQKVLEEFINTVIPSSVFFAVLPREKEKS